MALPSTARPPRATPPASARLTPAAPATAMPAPTQVRRLGCSDRNSAAPAATNNGAIVSSTAEDATVVYDSEEIHSAKCSPSKAPDPMSRP